MVSSSQIRGTRSRLVAHGWNIDIDAAGIVPALVQPFRGLGTGWFEGGCICTLLGPEGPGHTLFGVCGREPLDLSWFRLLVGCGEGTARTLRTTQWTRAS